MAKTLGQLSWRQAQMACISRARPYLFWVGLSALSEMGETVSLANELSDSQTSSAGPSVATTVSYNCDRMAKKSVDATEAGGSALTHNPFSKLGTNTEIVSKLAPPRNPSVVVRTRPVQPQPPPKLSMRQESKGRAGKVVTRISGIPSELLDIVASHLRKALGCGATLEGVDVVLLGNLKERAAEWFEKMGDVRKLARENPVDRPKASPDRVPVPRHVSGNVATRATGTKRGDVRPGLRVAVVMKADQETGKLTEGIVRELLTNSVEHPRGIKVRLDSGEVGRVKMIYE